MEVGRLGSQIPTAAILLFSLAEGLPTPFYLVLLRQLQPPPQPRNDWSETRASTLTYKGWGRLSPRKMEKAPLIPHDYMGKALNFERLGCSVITQSQG